MHPTSYFPSPADGTRLATYRWDPAETPIGVVQITHGVAEHAGRYDRLAQALTEAGYLVRAHDHRGHGNSTDPGRLGDFGQAGFPGLVEDLGTFGASIHQEHPDLPLFLIAHSMGSMAAQEVVLSRSTQYAGVVLSGSTAVDGLAEMMSAAAEDDAQPAGLAAFNAGFEHRTGYEWLSRDVDEVDRYVADPLSGFDLPEDTVPAMLSSGPTLADPDRLSRIDERLPVLILSGQDDPLADGGRLLELVAERYRDAGLTDITVSLHPGARHEVFNETSRNEITREVLSWMARRR